MEAILKSQKLYIKFAKLKEVEPYLCLYPVTFKSFYDLKQNE